MPEKFQQTHNNNQEAKTSRVERLKEKAEKFMKRVRQGTLVLGILVSIHNIEIHSNHVEKESVAGKDIFKHTDEQTTHILNYISGKDSLSWEDQRILYKNLFEGITTNIPQNFDSLTKDQVISFLVKEIKTTDQNYNDKTDTEVHIEVEKMFQELLPTHYDYNDTLYKALWETEKEFGTPKVRWTVGNSRNVLLENGGVDHYSSPEHTIYIHPGDYHNTHQQLQSLFSEWPHAKQFHDEYLHASLETIKEGIRIATDAIYTHDFMKSQGKEYGIKGSLENEAHKKIEPQIRDFFDKKWKSYKK